MTERNPHDEALLEGVGRTGRRLDAPDVLLPVAVLILLRWFDEQEREAEAVAAFDGRPYRRLVPYWMGWKDIGRMVYEPDPERSIVAPESQLSSRWFAHWEENDAPQPLRDLWRRVGLVVRQRLDVTAFDTALFTRAFEWVDAQPDFSSAEQRQALADAFERLLTRASSDLVGEYQTPEPLAELMLDLAAPRPGERIYDPCFGIGGLLARAAVRLSEAPSLYPASGAGHPTVYGCEIDPAAYTIGAARTVLAGVTPQLELGDTLERDLTRNGLAEGFDCILAVPPFGQRVAPGRYPHFPVTSTDGTDLFLQHVMAALRPGGRAVVAVPEAFLFKSGPTQHVRKRLIEEVRLEGVLPLPEGAFAPYTRIRAALLAFRRLEPQRTVWFFSEEDAAKALGRQGRARVTLAVREDKVRLQDVEFLERREAREELAFAYHAVRDVDEDAAQSTWEGASAFAVPVATSRIASRDYELLAKRPGEDELEAFLDQARERIAGLQVSPLHHLAELRRGRHYRRDETTEELGADGPALIRVSDIKEGALRSPALRLTATLEEKEARYTVRPGDLLLSVSGTIGKVAVVSEERAGAVATSGVLVLRPREGQRENLRPGYLARLLQSALYQDWLQGHARGATIQHLSLRDVSRLRIPVPPLDQQARVEAEVAEGADATEVMRALAEARTPDPLKSWLLSSGVRGTAGAATGTAIGAAASNRALAWLGGAGVASGLLAVLGGPVGVSVGAAGFSAWQALRLLRERSRDEVLSVWMGRFTEIGQQLEEALEIELGPERLALLEGLRLPAHTLLDEIPEGEPAVRERALAISRALAERIEREREALLENVRVTARLEPAVVELAPRQLLTLSLRNEGPLRLRNLTMEVQEIDQRKEAAQFPAGQSVALELRAPADAAGEHPLTVRWHAARLDGAEASGEIELAYRVRSVRDAVAGDFRAFGRNPYIAGKRLKPEVEKHRHLFKGREETIGRLVDALDGQGGAATVIIEGARRIGKSSLAGQVMAAPDLRDGWLPVYCDLQGEQGHQADDETDDAEAGPTEGLETAGVFYGIARGLAFAAADAGFAFDVPGFGRTPGRTLSLDEKDRLQETLRARFYERSAPAHLLDLFVAEVLEAVAPKTLLLVLDEFDKIQQGIQNGVTDPQVPENLRALFQRHDLAVVIVGSPRLRRLREQYFNALYGFAEPVVLGPLESDAARRLITEPVEGRLVYAPAAVDYVLDLTACQPHIIQSLCREVFNTCKREGTHTVTTVLVEACANTVAPTLPHFKHVFETDAESDRKRFLIAVTETHAERGPLTFAAYEQHLEREGVATKGLEDDLDDLVHEEILARDERRGEATYRLRVPLLAFWLRNADNHDYAILRSRAAAEHPA